MHDDGMELIARGVLIGPRGLLLCRNIGKDYTYLPGGHIEYAETAHTALIREINEEMGMKVEVDDFLGVVEHIFTQETKKHHEINLVFMVSGPAVERRAKFTMAEPALEYVWQPINALHEANLLPRPLRTLIPQWTRGKQVAWTSDVRE
jgi:8-oxo-dGTP diphosphatase